MQRTLITSILLVCSAITFSQYVDLKSGVFKLKPCERFAGHAEAKVYKGAVHYLLQFEQGLDAASRNKLHQHGVYLLSPLRNGVWLTSVDQAFDLRDLEGYGSSWYAELTPPMKLDPALTDRIAPRNSWKGDLMITVLPYPDVDGDELLQDPLILRAGFSPLNPAGTRLLGKVSREQLVAILSHPGVMMVEKEPAPAVPEDILGRTFHRAHAIGSTINGLPGLDGRGVTVVVNDDGFVGPHIDMEGRTDQSAVAGDFTGTHGDMVAGILAGAGNLDPTTAGMAPGAFVNVQQYDFNLPNTVALHQNDGAMIFNSSYGDGCNDGYTSLSQQVDQEINANPSLIQVFSTGNSGGSDCGYGAGAGWGNVTGGHKVAKNVIATANLTSDGQRVASSSRGPAQDGRIKPDISAFGAGQISLDPDNQYDPGGGTSAASPGIAGTLALLYEGWRDLHGSDPESGLLKAFLLNTAHDLGNVGPDYSFGWGRVNALRAWRAMEEDRYLVDSIDQGGMNAYTFNVPANVSQMRIMLYWMDPAGAVLSASALVNDIDMTGTAPNGTTVMPWVLATDPDPQLLAAPATTGVDSLNNVEQIAIFDPDAGTWTINVQGNDVPLGPQRYFIVHEYIMKELEMVYPIGGECLPPGSHRVRWDGVDTSQPYSISYSVDSGMTWSPSVQVQGDLNHLDLNLVNTVTAGAKLRVQQASLSAESGFFSIMGTPINLQFNANCLDSTVVSWDPVSGADSYVIHMLGTMYMDSIGATTDTSYTVTGLQPAGEEWFSVSALNNNGACSQRAIAIQRSPSIFNCPLAIDLASDRIISPGNSLPACQPQDVDVRFVLVNEGSATLDTVNAYYAVNGGTAVQQQFTTPLAPQDSIEVVWSMVNLGLNTGLNELKVWGAAPGEQYPINDTLTWYISSLGALASLPFNEDWETSPVCNDGNDCDEVCPLFNSPMVNEEQPFIDALEWRVDQGGTPSNNTGPNVDHTLGTSIGRYAYVEATPGCILQKAEMVSPCFQLPTDPVELSYWYHMSGDDMGDLHLDVFANGEWDLDVMAPVVGDQGNAWLNAIVPLNAYQGELITFRFRGVTGPGFESDIAVDDLMLASTVNIEEQHTGGFSVTPGGDPGQYLLQLTRPFLGPARLSVHDVLGREVFALDGISDTRTAVDLSDQASGVMFFRLSIGSHQYVQRIPHY